MPLNTLPSYTASRTFYTYPTDEKARQRHGGFMKKALIGTAVTAVILGGGGVVLGKTRRDLLGKGLGPLSQHALEGLKKIAQSVRQKLEPIVKHGIPAFNEAWAANATTSNFPSRVKQSLYAFLDVLKANPPKENFRGRKFGPFG